LCADEFVKQLSAILFSLLLVWAQLSAAPAPVTPTQPAHACCHCGGKMSCCSAPSSGSQPVSAIPSNSSVQNQWSLLAPAMMVWTLPKNTAGSISSASRSPFMATGVPLYARDCARLI
jgi:hypothetical protein